MRRLVMSLFPCLASITVVIGCGAEKSKDEQADEFYDEKLHTADTKTCNDGGHLYDALEAACKTDVKLATYECTRENVGTHVDDDAGLTELDGFIADGFELHQCGETENQAYLMIVNKGKTSKEATLEIRRLGLNLKVAGSGTDPNELRFSDLGEIETTADTCTEFKVEFWKSAGETGAGQIAAPEEAKFFLGASSTDDLALFTDSKCSEATDPGAPGLKIAQGEKEVALYFKFTGAGTGTLNLLKVDASDTFSVDSTMTITAK